MPPVRGEDDVAGKRRDCRSQEEGWSSFGPSPHPPRISQVGPPHREAPGTDEGNGVDTDEWWAAGRGASATRPASAGSRAMNPKAGILASPTIPVVRDTRQEEQ